MPISLLAGRYRLGEKLGSGALSDVYRASDTRLGRTVAVKILRADVASDGLKRGRFKGAAAEWAKLSHPGIVSVYDHGDTQGYGPYLVLEYVDGRSLRDILDANGPRSERRALSIAIDLCDALGYAHGQGVIHRGLLPAHVLITGDKATKLNNVGLGGLGLNTAALSVLTSPEQSMGQRPDARSDLYALGCVLFEMLTGEPLFSGPAIKVAADHFGTSPRPPSELQPKINRYTDQVVDKALSKNPNLRFQSAEEMRVALVDAQEGRPTRPVRRTPPPAPARTVTRPQRPQRQVFPAAPTPELRGKNLSVLRMKTTRRREEPHGEDVYTFNNARSTSSSTETIHLAHTAKFEVGVDARRSTTVGGTVGVRILDAAGVEGKIQREILAKRTLSLSKEISYNQTTAINIPPSTHVRVRIRWKLIWEEGVVTVGRPGDPQAEVPYAITVGLRFDKDTEDVT